MEQHVKLKLKEFTEAQTIDISTKLEGESLKIRKYSKELCSALQSDLYKLLSN